MTVHVMASCCLCDGPLLWIWWPLAIYVMLPSRLHARRLSGAGALPLDATSLHVVLAATHCFDESLMSTLIERCARCKTWEV